MSSGAEVAKETTVIPITSFDNFSLKDKLTEDRTNNSPPTTKSTNPAIIYKTLIFCFGWANIVFYVISVYFNSLLVFLFSN